MPLYELIIIVILLLIMLWSARAWWHVRYEKRLMASASKEIKTAAGIQHKLLILDINLTPISLLIGIIAMATFAYMAVHSAFPQQQGVAILIAIAILVGSYFILDDLVTWRTKRVESTLVDAMDTMLSALQAGSSSLQAISTAASLTKGPIKSELNEIVTRFSSGYDARQAVNRLLNRYNTEGTRLFAQSLVARHQTGSDFQAMLQAVNQLMRQRMQQYNYIKSQMSGTRYAALFCGLLPYVLIPLFLTQEPAWFEPLLQHPNGANYLSIALLLQLLGFFWLRKVLRASL